MKVLVTGFEAFGDISVNPTALLVEALLRNEIQIPQGMLIKSALLPVTFTDSFNDLEAVIKKDNPDIVMALGVAIDRNAIELERVAINCLDAKIPDNKGYRPRDEWIDEEGEAAYFSSLPLRVIENKLTEAHIPCRISNSAGTYVCNYLFYKLMAYSQRAQIKAGFIHVPSEAALSLQEQKRALGLILDSLRSLPEEQE